MIWLDIIDPKYVLFFKSIIPQLEKLDSVLVTTRQSDGYDECARLLKLFNITSHAIGGYGGVSKLGKLQARLDRQNGFLNLFKKLGETPRLFITGASVDGVQSAFGLGIPIVHFADTPVANERFNLRDITILSRLSIPLSTIVFRPFIVPEICYTSLGLESTQVIPYHFIDVALWLQDMPMTSSFSQTLQILNNNNCVDTHILEAHKERVAFCNELLFDPRLPIILVREEEYKAHYVKQQLPIIYEATLEIYANFEANILIMPRYAEIETRKMLKLESIKNPKAHINILSRKLTPHRFYPHIDVMIGGGGTMNLESCYLGIPTISTRSLLLFHDRYLIDNGLMWHCKNIESILTKTKEIITKAHTKRIQNALFAPKNASFDEILPHIEKLLNHTPPKA